MTLSFKCPKCEMEALSVDEGKTIGNAGVSDPKLLEWLKSKAKEVQMKEYLFWLCENNKCPNYGVYYRTTPHGKLIDEYRFNAN